MRRYPHDGGGPGHPGMDNRDHRRTQTGAHQDQQDRAQVTAPGQQQDNESERGTARLQRGTPWTTVFVIPKKSIGYWPYPVGISPLAG